MNDINSIYILEQMYNKNLLKLLELRSSKVDYYDAIKMLENENRQIMNRIKILEN